MLLFFLFFTVVVAVAMVWYFLKAGGKATIDGRHVVLCIALQEFIITAAPCLSVGMYEGSSSHSFGTTACPAAGYVCAAAPAFSRVSSPHNTSPTSPPFPIDPHPHASPQARMASIAVLKSTCFLASLHVRVKVAYFLGGVNGMLGLIQGPRDEAVLQV